MAYTDDAVLSKLSALNESHDSIATTAQWIMFHRRHAAQTVHLWLTKLKDLPSAKRLNMIYLANEVTQQTKARHKEDFMNAFAPFIADAISVAYKGASPNVQDKLRRVVDVWKERNIFDKEILQAVYSKIAEIDKTRPAAAAGAGFGAGFRSSSPAVPPELAPLLTQHEAISKSLIPMKSALTTAQSEYEKLTDPTAQFPALSVQAARLNGLLKTLANAEGAVAESMRTRKEMIQSLEKLLAANQQALEEEEGHMKQLSGRRTEIEQNKNTIENTIIIGQATNNQEQGPPGERTSTEPERPQVEALTPPHNSDADHSYHGFSAQNGGHHPVAFHTHHTGASAPQPAFSSSGIEILSNLASQYQAVPLIGSNKKRKLNSDEFPDLGGDDGIDADVKEMLRKDSRGN
ncbi:RNA polymerase II-binding domain-containing protein [Cladorrhinum sp. PSN259]|nr:RNA polymerase II-binding domain-containing protein [Cladorrhinum sp. PSN259]